MVDLHVVSEPLAPTLNVVMRITVHMVTLRDVSKKCQS